MPGSLDTVTLTLVRVVLLAGPAVLAFFSGGFFDGPRTAAAVVAWALVTLLAVGSRAVPLPRSTGGRIAVAGLALLTGWVALSSNWSTLEGVAQDDTVRLLVYLGALMAGVAAWADERAARAVEPALAAGVLVVIGYALAGRLLPELVELSASKSAVGRLEQPLTYWNAVGALAAIGLVLGTRLMGDATRATWLRAAAAAAIVPLAAGLYLTLSRGAVAALMIGLAALVLLAPTRGQLRAIGLALAASVIAAAVASVWPEVESLVGSASERSAEGAAVLALLTATALGAAAAQLFACSAERAHEGGGTGAGPSLRRTSPLVLAAVAALLIAIPVSAAAINVVAPGAGDEVVARNTSTFGSNRYAYWEVAAGAFASDPLRGTGAGSFRTEWEREREIDEPVRDAHSLYIETAAELGLVGVACVLALLAGLALAGRSAYVREPELVAGPIAALGAFAVHAGLDWDWEMPAVAGVAVVLAGALLARADAPNVPDSPP